MSDNIGTELINSRRQTIARLKELADKIDSINRHGKIAKVAGTSVSILGTVARVPLGITVIVLTGGIAAVPIDTVAIVFSGVGAVGSLTSIGADLGSNKHIKKKYAEAMAAVENDMKQGQKFLNLFTIGNAKLGISVIGGAAVAIYKGAQIAIRAGDAGLDALRVTAKISKVAGIIIIGISASVVLLPVDIYILVKNSKDIHYETKHEKAEEIRGLARKLERSLPDIESYVSILCVKPGAPKPV